MSLESTCPKGIEMPTKPYRIDVHHHIIPHEYVKSLQSRGITKPSGMTFPEWSETKMLEVMDRNGISTAITSISSPGVYFGDPAFARDLARQCNEISAKLVYDNPQRFGAFATLPLPDVEATLNEIDYAMDTLGLDGVVLMTNFGGRYLGDPMFETVFEELNRRKAVVYVHPTDPPGSNAIGLNVPSSLYEFTFDTTRAITNLIYSGTIERNPDLRFIFSHAGGTIPFLAWRISLGSYLIPNAAENAPKGFINYLKRLYYDTALSTSPYALRSLQELVDPSQILFGSDYPFAPEILTAEQVKQLTSYDGFNTQTRTHIERENALRLFPRLQS
ncbi:MAG: amidohydrolase family protein [Candidatus Jordarchaeaceae archaeon]